MNRRLQYVNLVGIAALACLSAAQWRVNRDLNLNVNGLESARHRQAAVLDERDKTLRGYTADLDEFRGQLIDANAALQVAEKRLAAAELSVSQLSGERDQLKISVTNWSAAVAARDLQLEEIHRQLRTLADDRNETVMKFNELAGKYQSALADLNARTRDLNALVGKYNALVKQLNETPAR